MSVTPFILTTENFKLISHIQFTDLVNITFQKETKSSFWERFFALKETSTNDYLGIHPEVSANEVDEIFETDYGRQKIFLLNNFTDRRIEVLRQTNPSSSRDDCGSGGYGGNCGSGKGGRGLSKVTDQREKYSCPLCATKHPYKNRAVCPWFSVCQVFLNMAIANRVSACTKHQYCKI